MLLAKLNQPIVTLEDFITKRWNSRVPHSLLHSNSNDELQRNSETIIDAKWAFSQFYYTNWNYNEAMLFSLFSVLSYIENYAIFSRNSMSISFWSFRKSLTYSFWIRWKSCKASCDSFQWYNCINPRLQSFTAISIQVKMLLYYSSRG